MKVIDDSNVIYEFEPSMNVVEKVALNEVFKVKTQDCFSGQIEREDQILAEIDYSRLNPATGPIYVESAEPGDLLKIKIHKIDVDRKGVALSVPGEGVLGHKANKSLTRIIDIKDGNCYFKDLLIPIRPMIGVIGVAPSDEDGACSTTTPWKHGGNMDTNDIKEGSVIYLPVSQSGALLALGDCHAIMGDGEVCFSGCEVAAEVTLELDIIKGKRMSWPLIETQDSTMIIGSGDTIDESIVNVTDEAVEYLMKGLNLSWEEAYILSSLVVDIRISQVVDPKKTVVAVIPKSIMDTSLLLSKIPN